ncbi:ST6B1 Sulfotransferase, partial [Polypterus senegalus]
MAGKAVQRDIEEGLKEMLQKAKNTKPEDLVLTYKGVKYPSLLCTVETLNEIPFFEARQDDLLLVAYPKCGFNWMISVLQKIISIDAEAIKPDEDIPRIGLIEFIKPEKLQMLVVFRNPKDTAVSYYHFCQNNPVLLTYESWDAFFSEFIKGDVPWGCYFDHAVEWNKRMDDENVLIVTYEDLKEGMKWKRKQTMADGEMNRVVEKLQALDIQIQKLLSRRRHLRDLKARLLEKSSSQQIAAL